MEKIIFYRYGNSGDHQNDYIFQDKEYLDNILNSVIKFSKEFSLSIASSYNINIDDYNKYILPNNIITCFYKDKNGILHEDCFQRRYIHTVTNHVN